MKRTKKQSTEAAVREIRRRARRKFAPEEKQIGQTSCVYVVRMIRTTELFG